VENHLPHRTAMYSSKRDSWSGWKFWMWSPAVEKSYNDGIRLIKSDGIIHPQEPMRF
jgi:hypothetical protein